MQLRVSPIPMMIMYIMIETVCLFKCEFEGFVKINTHSIWPSTFHTTSLIKLINITQILNTLGYLIWSAKTTLFQEVFQRGRKKRKWRFVLQYVCSLLWSAVLLTQLKLQRILRILRQLPSPAVTVYTKDIKNTISKIIFKIAFSTFIISVKC